MTEQEPAPVDFWFDALCPWAWITSRWTLEVQQVRPVQVTWHAMGLAVLNGGQADMPERYQELMADAWGPTRVVTAAEEKFGSSVVGPLYTALGTEFHLQKAPRVRPPSRPRWPTPGCRRPGRRDGLDRYDDALPACTARASSGPVTRWARRHLGERTSIFGPVVSPIPRGEAAAGCGMACCW